MEIYIYQGYQLRLITCQKCVKCKNCIKHTFLFFNKSDVFYYCRIVPAYDFLNNDCSSFVEVQL